jgi:hypothetical protein
VIKKIVFSSFALVSIINADVGITHKTQNTAFTYGYVVNIESCDKWGWCKLQDNKGYVKGHFFKTFPLAPTKAIKNTQGKTFLYKIRPVYKYDKPVFEFIKLSDRSKSSELLNAKSNYHYGYIRVEDINQYDKYLMQSKLEKKKKYPKIN